MRWIALLSLVVWGCTGGASARKPSSLPTDTAQIRIRIGSYDGANDALSDVWTLAVSPDGQRVYALENQDREVRIFARDGRFVATAGRAGGGPGEFGNPVALGFVGDTLWVEDFFTFRVSFFDEGGRFLGDFRPRVLARQGPDDHPPIPVGLLADGTLLGGEEVRSREVAQGVVTRVPVLRLRRDGSVIDTIAWRSIRNTALMVRAPKPEDRHGEVHTQQPFGRELPIVISGSDSSVYRVVLDSTTGIADLLRTRFDGSEVFRTSVGWAGPVLRQSTVDSTVLALSEGLRKGPSMRDVSAADLEKWIRDALYVPDRLPPVARMIRSSNGQLWLEKGGLGLGASTQWRVLSEQGALLRDVVIPEGIRVLAIHGTDVWGTQTDTMDVTFIVGLTAQEAH